MSMFRLLFISTALLPVFFSIYLALINPEKQVENLVLQSKLDEALACLEKSKKNVFLRNDPRIFLAAACVLRQKKEYKPALNELSKALDITQRFPLLWTFKGFACEHKLLADIYYQEALCYLELNDHETALGALDDALKIEIDPDALYQRALVLEYLGNLQGAESDLKMAIEKSIEPAKKELALHNRADYFIRQKQKDLAIIDYKAGLAQFECARAYCELGRLALQDSLYDQAIEYFSKSINKEETVNALRLRALTHTKIEEWKEAETDLDKALKLEPENALAKEERQNVHKMLELQKAK
ncbi:MAG: tetratricopeptide repeat protein [Candidatus Melainabacteria bacterium]|nr:tetratricopeptide repeat protein [Candidatus Melainabacteria bacterium]